MSEELKEVLERIVNKLDELDKRISALENEKTPKKTERRQNVIETSKFVQNVVKAKKGIAIVTKYAKFVKIDNNTAYVVLDKDEAVRYVKKLYREVMSLVGEDNGQSSESNRSASRTASRKKKSKVKIVEK